MMAYFGLMWRPLYAVLIGMFAFYPVLVKAADTIAVKRKTEEKQQNIQLLDPISVSATRTSYSLNKTPATISVITSEDLEEQQATNLREALRYQPGISIQRTTYRPKSATEGQGLDNNDAGVVIRGLGGNRILMIEDGIRLPNAFSFGPFTAGRTNYNDMDMLSSVEILRGPASTLFGSDGLAGAISFTTKTPKELLDIYRKNYYFSVHPTYDSSDRSVGSSISVAAGNDRLQAMFITDLRRGHETESNGAQNTSDYTRTTANPQNNYSTSYLGKLVANITPFDTLTFTGESVQYRSNTDVLSSIGLRTFGSKTWRLNTENRLQRDRFSLDYVHQNNDNPYVQVARLQIYHQSSSLDDVSDELRGNTLLAAMPVIRGNSYDEEIWGGSALLESHFLTGAFKHHLIYGVEGSVDNVSGLRTGNNANFPNQPFPNTDYTLLGAFIQDRILLGKWKISPGVRLDYYRLAPQNNNRYFTGQAASSSDYAISPELSVMYLFSSAFNPYIQYAHGFRAPLPDQVNNGFSNNQVRYISISNPNLKPEQSDSIELGAKGHLSLPYGHARYASAIYYGHYTDFINQIDLGRLPEYNNYSVYQFINAGSARIYGLEASFDWMMPNGVSFRGSVAYTKGMLNQKGRNIPLDTVMPLSFVFGLRYEPTEKWFVESDLMIQAGKNRGDMDPTRSCVAEGFPKDTTCFAPPASYVMDIRAGYQINKKTKLYLGVYNLFDRKYWTWSGLRNVANSPVIDAYSAPGRSVTVSLKMDF